MRNKYVLKFRAGGRQFQLVLPLYRRLTSGRQASFAISLTVKEDDDGHEVHEQQEAR